MALLHWNTFLANPREHFSNYVLNESPICKKIEIIDRYFSSTFIRLELLENVEVITGFVTTKPKFSISSSNSIDLTGEQKFTILTIQGRGLFYSDKISQTDTIVPKCFLLNAEDNWNYEIEANSSCILIGITINGSPSDVIPQLDFSSSRSYHLSTDLLAYFSQFKTIQPDNFVSVIELKSKLLKSLIDIIVQATVYEQQSIISPQDYTSVKMVAHKLSSNFSTKEKPQIKSLAREANMSASKLSYLFKSVYDEPIYSYHIRKKLEYAAALILGNNYSIAQVAIKVGYQGQSTKFVQIFKKYYGVTPKQYQLNQGNLDFTTANAPAHKYPAE